MAEQLKCFISASFGTDTSAIKNILTQNNVNVFDIYDVSVGESIQQILKKKLEQSDFALFIISQDSHSILYEIGVCEGMEKQYFIIMDQDFKAPFYVENRFFLRANLKDDDFLKLSIRNILQEIKKPISKNQNIKRKPKKYNNEIRENLRFCLNRTKILRQQGSGRELENLVEDTFKAIKLNYVQNLTHAPDKGVDFALWSDSLGKILGNPIIVEVKYGNLSSDIFDRAELQIKKYIEKSEAKLALLFYLDRENKRHKIKSSLKPLIIDYDFEDFINDLIIDSFENIILNRRNRIAHGLE